MLCPKCGKEMEHVNIEGVPIDRCPQDGVWLDRGELEQIISREKSGLHKVYRRNISMGHARIRQERRSFIGQLLGFY